MNWREHVKKKKGLLFLALLALAFSVLVGILSFRLGRRGQEAGEEKAAQEEKETGGSIGFGDGSVVVSPCLPDGTPCDFSAEAAPSSIVPLADRLVPELGSRESVAAAAAFYRREGGSVCRGMDSLQAGSVIGADTGFLPAAGLQVERGRGITERDVEEKRQVVLLDGRAAQILFPGIDPLGETVEVEGRLYQTIGIVTSQELQTGGGLAVIPESTWGEVYQYEEPKSVVLRLSEAPGEAFTEAEWEALRESAGLHAARSLNSMVPGGDGLRYRLQ